MSRVLVTGGSGFVGIHVILQLLEAGHEVRTTVRSLKREGDVRAMLKVAGVDAGEHLAFFVADLEQDAGWADAVAGCDYVLHVASPFPTDVPKDENELIRPARDGALRVLRAARDAGVKRVVLTSSFAAISYGQKPENGVFTEANWTNVNAPDAQPYPRSKTLAERAAWDFIASEGGGLELSVVNPVGIFGPALGSDLSSSVVLIRMMMNGAMPGAPRIYFGVVDVRDVADLHLRAMTHPAANGERFIAAAGRCVSVFEVATLLRERLGDAGSKAPRRQFPDFLVRLFGLFNPSARAVVPQLGVIRETSSQKARDLLGWAPRSNEEAIIASAESLVRLKLIKGQ
jgi:nucleoside-diphosphate-sugar epimerase